MGFQWQAYADRKEKMLQLRKQKEEEVFQSKQAARNAMIDAQVCAKRPFGVPVRRNAWPR